MRIATWNVNSIRSRQDHLLAWLERSRPDVVGLQETKVPDGDFPHDPLAALGYRAAVSGQKTYNGVALLSPHGLEDVRVGFSALLPGDAEAEALGEQRRVISAWVEGVRVVDLYVPNGSALDSDKYAYKLAWLGCLRRYLAVQRDQGEPLCVLGDFNIAPEARDLHDPAGQEGGIMASAAEREALRACLGDDLQDAFRLFEPDAGHWSWWDYRGGGWPRDRGWRIDHVYLCPLLQERAMGCRIDREERGRERPSDHAPVIVELADAPDEAEPEA